MVHATILGLLMLPGIAVYGMEVLTPHSSGGLFRQFAFTKLYWLAFAVYALATTLIVTLIGFVQALRQKPLRGRAVILGHVIPVTLVWLSISLGLHDALQDAWKRHGAGATPATQQRRDTDIRAIPAPPDPSARMRQYRAPGPVVEPREQTAAPAADD